MSLILCGLDAKVLIPFHFLYSFLYSWMRSELAALSHVMPDLYLLGSRIRLQVVIAQ